PRHRRPLQRQRRLRPRLGARPHDRPLSQPPRVAPDRPPRHAARLQLAPQRRPLPRPLPPQPAPMTAARAITLLHISDPQFGPKHRFSGTGHDTLFGRLRDDFEAMRARHGLVPDLILITGDLVETGKPSEFREFREFAEALADYFGLPRRKLVLIPGNHDISRAASEAYFKECEADEIEPVQPY